MRLTKNQNKLYNNYIINAIDFSDYEAISATTTEEKLQALYNAFVSENWFKNNQIRYNYNKIEGFQNWIQGLPNCFNIEFMNSNILDLAVKFGSLPNNATEKEEDKILNNYWHFIAAKTFQLFRKYNIV